MRSIILFVFSLLSVLSAIAGIVLSVLLLSGLGETKQVLSSMPIVISITMAVIFTDSIMRFLWKEEVKRLTLVLFSIGVLTGIFFLNPFNIGTISDNLYILRGMALMLIITFGLILLGTLPRTLPDLFSMKAPFLLVISFLGIIVIGTFLLLLPASRSGTTPVSFIDALFTSTSAVCVTGLVVLDTGKDFSMFGQSVILLLIQIGGLGIMTFAIFGTLLLGGRLSMHEKSFGLSTLDQESTTMIYRLIKRMVLFTATIELLGAIALYPYFARSFGTVKGIYYSLFHSVSAFCNAGFSLMSDSLVRFKDRIGLNLAFMGLIILGGIGFTVIDNVFEYVKAVIKKKPKPRITLHTKIVLVTTAVLIIVGAVFFGLFEWNNSMKALSLKEKILASLFSSVTARTAGFNTIPMDPLKDSTYYFMSLLMFIGASPASTGGGIKTTTFALLFLSVLAILRSRPSLVVAKREVPQAILSKAIAIFVLSLTLVVSTTLLLALIEDMPFIRLYFESVSAFGTVGLSSGITPKLSSLSKLVIILTMFIGRVGPLTIVLAVGKGTKEYYRYPEERVIVG